MTRAGRAAVAIWLLLAAGCAWQLASRLAVTTDLSAFLPPAASRAQQVLIGQMREGVASRMMLIGIDGASEQDLAQTSRRLAERLAMSDVFETVANGSLEQSAKERTLFLSLRYALSPGVTAERFTAAGLQAALQEELEFLTSPFGMLAARLVPSDPTGEARRIAAAVTPSGAPSLRHGAWFTSDGRRALLVAQTRAAGFDADAQDRAARMVREHFAQIAPPGAALRLAGPGIAAGVTRATIERDAQWASLVSAAGVLLLLAAVYRSLLPVALSALPAASGLLAGITAVSLWFGPVHGITLGFGAILIGEAVDYPTYLYAHAARGEALDRTLRRIGATLRLAVLTTACGSIAMLLSSFRGLAQLGVLTLVGVAAAGLVTRWVLPALTPASALQRKLVALPFDPGARSRSAGGRAWIVAVSLLAGGAVLAAAGERMWDDDLAGLSPLPAELKSLDAELRSQLGAPDVRQLAVIAAGTKEAALEKSELAAATLDRAVAAGWIGGYDLASRYVPSRRTQERRRAALPEPSTLAANLAQALRAVPFRSDIFAPFLADIEHARHAPWIDGETWRGTTVAPRLASLLVPRADGWLAFAPLAGVRDARALENALRDLGDRDVFLIDLRQEADAMVAGYRREALQLIAFGLLCITAIVYFGLQSAALTGLTLVPVLTAALLDVATLVAIGERLTVVHVVALLLVVGVGLNYALFFGRPDADPADRALTRLSLAVASLATLCAAVALATCTTPVLRAIGLTIAIGTVYAFALAAAFGRHGVPAARA